MTKKMTLNELLESNLSLEEIDYILEEEEDPSYKLQAPATIWQYNFSINSLR